jgi:predicted transcriptional regulator of viral defense system
VISLPNSFTTRKALTRAGTYLLGRIEAYGKPILSAFDLSFLVEETRKVSAEQGLRLRKEQTFLQDFRKLKSNLFSSSQIAIDPDYHLKSILRVLSIPDLPAEEIVCLADPLAYVSHMSAMHRWGLTLRVPKYLQISKPEKALATECLNKIKHNKSAGSQSWPIRLEDIEHPNFVRKMPVKLHRSERIGASRLSPGSFTRLASIGQTFADMVQEPELCGGINHVLDVWEESAQTYLSMIVPAVDLFCSALAKSRAGYILDERLDLNHPLVEKWKKEALLFANKKLDPSKEYGSKTSKTWNLSINV